MKFIKAETNGNDFVIINENESSFSNLQKKKIADRKFGIGCDQLIFFQNDHGKYLVDFFNQDASHANMCGNGTCAISKYIQKTFDENSKTLELIISGKLYKTSVLNDSVTVSFDLPEKIGNIISTGNKHFVTKISDIENLDEIAEKYPECNLHFIDLISSNTIKVKTFERGVGWTLACGSGAIACGFFSKIKGKIKIIQDGGESIVEVFDNSVNLTTSPKLIFEGEFYE